MATLIQMHCNDCDFKTDVLRFGANMVDRTMIAPAINTNSNEIVEADLEDRSNNELVFYTDRKLKGTIKRRSTVSCIQAYDHSIQLQNNFCPQCNGFTLQVEIIGLSD